MVFGEVSESRMISVLLLAIGITFQNHRLHIVVHDLSGDAAKCLECPHVASQQRFDTHVSDKLRVADAAVAQRRNERREHAEFVPRLTKLNPVHLHLMSRLCFESDYRVGTCSGSKLLQVLLHPA
ncbi:hypothetical protein LMG24235_08753 [Paraburkholderia sabiae]|nr:hypothetical protein LMG24235_08753 [Paraburkholderia sabiae]